MMGKMHDGVPFREHFYGRLDDNSGEHRGAGNGTEAAQTSKAQHLAC
jgi:hypothetical protein